MARGDLERGYSRSRERDERIRAGLQPLAPEERPLALRLSALLALLIALSNVIALAAGVHVQGNGKSPVAGGLLFALIMVLAAVGMWQKRYWAVLGFEALLGVSIVYAALSLMVAANGVAALLCVAVIVIAAPLFWFLIRIMARIQMPQRPTRTRRD